MNLFWLHKLYKVTARLHSDQHIVKMVLECAQIMSTVYYHYDQEPPSKYRKTHARHPCTIWCAQNREHFLAAGRLALELSKEYTLRYGRTHGCHAKIRAMLDRPPDFARKSPPTYARAPRMARWNHLMVPLAIADPKFHHDDACVAYGRYYMDKLRKDAGGRMRRWQRRSDDQALLRLLTSLYGK